MKPFKSCSCFLMFFVFALLATAQDSGQHIKGSSNTKKDAYHSYIQCYHHKKYSSSQRKKFFPFNIKGEIQLIKFYADVDRVVFESEEEDTTVMNAIKKSMYAPSNSFYHLNKGRLVANIKLSAQGVDSLTDILYNYGYPSVKSGYKVVNEPTGCYNPRNAILFFDRNGKLKEFIELCFQCDQYRTSSKKIRDIIFCQDKFSILKKFFLERRISD